MRALNCARIVIPVLFRNTDQVRSRDANDSAESSALTIEKQHYRSTEFWNIHEEAIVKFSERESMESSKHPFGIPDEQAARQKLIRSRGPETI